MIPFPAIRHRRWLLDGEQLSLCYEKARPISRAKHDHPEVKLWLSFEFASGVFALDRMQPDIKNHEFRP